MPEELTVRRGSVGLGRSKSVRCSRVKFGLVSLDDDDGDGEGDDGSAKGKSRGTCDGFIARASVIVAIGGERQDQKEEEATAAANKLRSPIRAALAEVGDYKGLKAAEAGRPD